MNPWKSLGRLRREIWVLFTTLLVNRMGTMVLPFLVLYLTRRLGFSPERASLALMVYGGGALVVAPLAGRLCDRVGALRIMKASLFLSGLVLLVFPLVSSFGGVLLLTLLWAVVNEAFRPANMALLSHLAGPDLRKAAFSLNRLAVNMGMSVGPALGGLLAMVSFRWLFWADGATSILAGCILVVMAPREPEHVHSKAPGDGEERAPLPSPAALANGRFLFFLAALLPTVMVFFQLESAFPLYLVRDVGLSASAFGLLFTVNTVLIILLEIPLNTAMARWPHHLAMPLGALLCCWGFAAVALAGSFGTVALTVVIWTFGEMILFPGSATCVADMAPEDRRGEYMGIYTMSFSLAFMAGPWLGALILERLGPIALWGGAALLGFLSAAMMWLVNVPKRPPETPPGP